jgi:hypothetical protein
MFRLSDLGAILRDRRVGAQAASRRHLALADDPWLGAAAE